MAVDLADGPLGIEARHKWINIETATVLATLGDLTTDPHFLIRDISGFELDIEDHSEPKTEAAGAIPYPSRALPRNGTYTIDVVGSTAQMMRRGGAMLSAAFGPDISTGLQVERVMIITPHPDYGSAEHAYRARCLQIVPPNDAQDRGPSAVTPYVRTWVIGVRMYDPRFYEWDPDSPIGLVAPKW